MFSVYYDKKESLKMNNKNCYLYEPKNGFDRLSKEEEAAVNAYCERYKKFLDHSKTERLCLATSLKLAQENGFVPYEKGMKLKAGDKIYTVSKEKNLFLAVMGEKSLEDGCNFSVAHIDNPHLDVKPRPAYEEDEIAYFKTYLYGWLRKHQWLALPLAMHGVVFLADGSKVEINIGEDENDPRFIINDLLPHLGKAQNERPLKDVVPHSAMNIIVGTRPLPEGDSGKRVKQNVMTILGEKYGISEEDLISAELELVPSGLAHDVGFDRSLIASFGHDDRVCAYAQLSAILETSDPQRTALCVLIDKEEVNSDGVSGMKSRALDRFMKQLCSAQGVDLDDCYANSFCLSADVTSAYDPNFPEIFEKHNSAFVNYGIALSKYTGHDGDKSDGSDASAEVVSRLRSLLNNGCVFWQMAEIGDPEAGGGGTIAKMMANRNVDTIDAGVPVMSMHAPFETVSKIDCYMTYKAVKTLYRDNV